MPNVSLIDGHIDEPKTNYDRIRNMSVEEMAEFIYNDVSEDYSGLKSIYCEDMFSKEAVVDWLESEVTK